MLSVLLELRKNITSLKKKVKEKSKSREMFFAALLPLVLW